MGRPRKSVLQGVQDNNTTVLDVKPIKTLAPMFPAQLGFHTATTRNNPNLLCVTPFGAPNAESGTNPPGFTPGQMPPPMFLMGGAAGGVPTTTPQVLKSPKLKKTVLNPTPVQMQSPTGSTGQVKKRRGRPRKSEVIAPVQMKTPPVQMETPPVQMETPPVQMGSPPVQMETTTIQMGSPPVQMETTTIQMGSPPVQIGSPPVSTGEVKRRRGRPRKIAQIVA